MLNNFFPGPREFPIGIYSQARLIKALASVWEDGTWNGIQGLIWKEFKWKECQHLKH